MSEIEESDRQTIFRARAARLAQRPASGDSAERTTLLICAAGGEQFGLPLARLARVAPYQRPAVLPGAGASTLGLIGRGGLFYQLHDLAALLGLTGAREDGTIIFLRKRAPPIALRVDSAEDVGEVTLLRGDDISAMRPSHSAVRAFGRTRDNEIISILELDDLLPSAGQTAGGAREHR